MTEGDAGLAEIRDGFLEEAADLLAAFEDALPGLESADPDQRRDAIDAAYRAVHTVKGGAGMFDMRALVEAASEVEDRLTALREAGREGTPDLAALQAGADAMRARITPAPAVPHAPEGAEARGTHADAPAPSRHLRIRSDSADRLGRLSAELTALEGSVAEVLASVPGDRTIALSQRLRSVSDAVGAAVGGLRAQPAGPLLRRMASLARDAARAADREVTVEFEGEAVEIDAAILDALVAPLTHAVRNAIDHGIEPPEARVAAGKPRAGRLRLMLRQNGARLDLSVSDDGGGFDVDALRARARAAGATVADGMLDGRDLLALAALAGVSSRDRVTDRSGRGVGMDAVVRAAAAMGARVDLATRRGQGTTLSLRFGGADAVLDVVGCAVNGVLIAIPVAAVRSMHGHADRAAPPRPTVSPAPLLGAGPTRPGPEVVDLADPALPGIAVDRVVHLGPMPVRPVPDYRGRAAWLTGAAITTRGHVAYVVDPSALAEAAA